MCGIAGLVGGDPRLAEPRIRAMLSRLTHRGPDDEGVLEARGAVLGARRLSIIDLVRGHQPMTNEDGSISAVQNGEIYNFVEVRADLERRGHRFRTSNDTEILPHAYEEFGDALVDRLRGMFAIAIWDEREQRLLLARDRVGKKPLVYAEVGGVFAFASEIQALLTLPLDRAVDEHALAQYLCLGYIPAPRTGFRDVRSLPPGSVLNVEAGRVRDPRRYWQISYEPKSRMSEAEAVERLRAEIDEAVRVRLMSDVPLGAFLSGGLDSSTVVAFMAANAQRVRTFAIGFADEDYSELKYARLVAERFGTEHQEFIVEPSAIEVLPMLVRHLGNPFADSSIVPTYYVAKIAREHVTVALNGDGGDELFAGYDRYTAARLGHAFGAVPTPVLHAVGAGLEALPRGASSRFVTRARRLGTMLRLDADEQYLALVSIFTARTGPVGRRAQTIADPVALFRAAASDAKATDTVDRFLAIDAQTYLPGDLLVKMDIATMASSLEGRSPLLDHKLIEFVAHLPASTKVRGITSKYLLRKLMHGQLPELVLTRRKMGFAAPVGRWMRGPMRALVESVLLDMPPRPLIDRVQVARITREHLDGHVDHAPRLWSLLMLELWFRSVVEDDVANAGAGPMRYVGETRSV